MLPVQEVIITGILFMAAAYLLGSLPFSLWIGKGFFDTDVRDHGSGNAGATNTWRVLGWKAGLPVLLLDIGKGFAATFLPYIYSSISSDPDLLLWERVFCGILAAVGHIYPVFAGFRGGKAVATLLGVLIGIMPVPALASLAVFILGFSAFRFVSLGSILAGISLPIMVYFLSEHPVQLMFFGGFISVLVLLTHRKNIGRLLRGEESKLQLSKRKGA
ncbi:glycerol-3-phosphate 1-O-acyltransferase PlsY [Bacteroidota bacterium]